MAKFVISTDFLDKTIPELKNIIRNSKEFEKFARERNVGDENPMLVTIKNQHKQAKDALKIVELEANLKKLKQSVADKKLSYLEKWESN